MSEQEKSTRPAMSLAEMREIDIKTVDRNSLVDMNTVKIDPSLPQKERMQEFIRQIKNPYCYLDQGIVVKISFSGEKTMDQCLAHYLKTIEG